MAPRGNMTRRTMRIARCTICRIIRIWSFWSLIRRIPSESFFPQDDEHGDGGGAADRGAIDGGGVINGAAGIQQTLGG